MAESYQISFFDSRGELLRRIINPADDLGHRVRQGAGADAVIAEIEVVVVTNAGPKMIWRGTREEGLAFVTPA